MLENIAAIPIVETVYRLANPPRIRAALDDLGTSFEGAIETLDFMKANSADDVAILLASPFDTAGNYTPSPTRFSDGTWRVFYSAIEPETCAAEVSYWCSRNVQSAPPTQRRFYYRELRCQVTGNGFDVRPMHQEWPFLTGDNSAYPQCQELAREARNSGADAMLCPSARRPGGSTVPVFVQQVLSNAAILGQVIIQTDNQGNATVSRP